ncbi:hypothetical protein P153DRAFT_382985 [Dothidotthia symphoricarpi CBS 119687]|uniref:Uncharacterized protein n=1 Tax=Dothidotthia symphoricarpi CBS 119687 TaxID=1392245 RepID=A0A6A6AJE1_9PLEO|nr:uncharacterized protein P153DRAFT_382985 [Dothidotthia symphoricarpi CBS 119687]KAF2132092.1 hypothetical protein P153DRAFT_382985 [Dothidotthia symphoricarpi CBS 119687]
MENEQDYISRRGAMQTGSRHTASTAPPPAAMSSEEEVAADVDEPPDLGRTPRPSIMNLHESSVSSFTKSVPRCDVKQSLLTTALQSQANSNSSSPVEEHYKSPIRGMSVWSNNSVSTAELTSDGGFTSPGTRTSTPSPPLPASRLHSILPTFNKKPFELPLPAIRHDDESHGPLEKVPTQTTGEQGVEATLGRKRRIMFACGGKQEKMPTQEPAKPAPSPLVEEPPKRSCTIKFTCPTKISTDALSKTPKPRLRVASPAPSARRIPKSPKPPPKPHRGSDSTVRNNSPVSVRKAPIVDRIRRLSANSDLARCEAYRFHEFASSEEEVDEWTLESTVHRNRLTVGDTLKVENNLRQLAEEAEEEALEDEEEDDDDEVADDDDDDDDLLDEDQDGSDAYSDVTDEGFQTDDEEGFAVSDDESDAGSDYNWWAPGPSTAATSMDLLDHLRPKVNRTLSESSSGSLESGKQFKMPEKSFSRRKKSKPVNIRAPSPELPDSTDFVCGTLDEDRPAEAAYMTTLERRRAAKHKPTPQDIDPSFPTSDPDLPDDEEDEVSEVEHVNSESDNYFMMHGRMDPLDGELRGRRIDVPKKRSPAHSPRRLRSPPPTKRTMHRSPPPPTKRVVHRSPPPRKLFGASPKRARSPAPARLQSPPLIRRGSINLVATRQRSEMSIRFSDIGERPALITSASVPRTPMSTHPPPLENYDEEETGPTELPRRAIAIQVGLEKKRQRRKEQLYRKQHRKGVKEKRAPPPGRGAERMRDIGLELAAHKGKTAAFAALPSSQKFQDPCLTYVIPLVVPSRRPTLALLLPSRLPSIISLSPPLISALGCSSALPSPYEDNERAVKVRKKWGKVTEQNLSSFDLTEGIVRAMVSNRELYVVETLFVDSQLSECPRYPQLALLRCPRRIENPNIQFVFSVEDRHAQPTKPVRSLARRAQDHNLWLIPDFGFWSWDMPFISTMDEVAHEAVQRRRIEP